ncbi:protein DpdD [Glaciecola sp. SC05]|uniref:protein DpdD n=1 Tax=Glaciecola sp. SC05 TaxID=1987355 RepID=UPI003527980E
MNSSNYPQWFYSFFSAENEISFDKPNTHGILNSISPLFLKATDNLNTHYPFFLASYSNSKLYFYGFAHSKKDLLELKNSLHFALGTSHTSATRVINSPELNFEEEAIDNFIDGILKFEFNFSNNNAKNQSSINYVVTTLGQVQKRFEHRPVFNIKSKRPVGRILRDFFISLDQKEHYLIDEYKEELRSAQGLSHRNFVGIELQTFAAKEEWEKVFQHPSFSDYVNGIIPSKIYLVIIEALAKSCELDLGNLSDFNFENLLTKLDPYAPLLINKASLPKNQSFEPQWKSWIIFNLVLGSKNLSSNLPDFIDKEWFDVTYQQIKASRIEMEVREGFSSELKTLIKNDKTLEAATKLLKYSNNAPSLEIPEIVDWLNELPAKVTKQVKSIGPLRQKWNQLEDFIFDAGPVEQITDDSKQEEISAQVTWDAWFSSHTEISTDVLLESDESGFDIKHITENIKKSSNAEKIRDITPTLMEWIQNKNKKTNAAFWLSLIEIISIDDQTSSGTILLLKELIFKLLEVPHSSDEYNEALCGFELGIEAELSIRSLPHIVEFLERLHDFSIKDENKLTFEIWPKVRGFAERNWVDIDIDQISVLLWLEKRLSADTQILKGLEPTNSHKELAGKRELKGIKVAISTLTEKAGIRAAEILRSQFEGVEFILNHDKVATDKLTNLAKTSDYFIFCNKSAAHQAYYAVKDITKNIIYVDGKGSSSIVRAFLKGIIT